MSPGSNTANSVRQHKQSSSSVKGTCYILHIIMPSWYHFYELGVLFTKIRGAEKLYLLRVCCLDTFSYHVGCRKLQWLCYEAYRRGEVRIGLVSTI